MNEREDCFHLGVKALIRNNEGKLLLLQRDHPSQNKYWDIPGGRLQKGKTILATLRREIEEEIGLKKIQEIYPFEMILTDMRIAQADGDVGLIFSIFLCDVPEPFEPILSEEHMNFEWFTPLQAAQKLIQYPADFLKKLENLTINY